MSEEKKLQFDFALILGKLKNIVINFLIPLVALTVTLLLGVFYIRPSISELPEKRQELETKITTRDILTKKVSSLNKLRDYQSVLDENLEIVNKVLVPEPEAPRLLDQASQMADKAGLSLDKLSYSYSSKGKSGGSFDMINVSMGVKSSLEQFILFMEIVENASRYVSVPTFRYSISDRSSEEGNLSSTFTIDSPYLFVQSTAVTDDPINLDITSSEFISFIDMLKSLDYYDFLNPNIEAVEENIDENTEGEETPATEENPEPVEPQPLPLEENTEEPAIEESGTEPVENNSIFPSQ
jgi:Tfp pilus assembly protein PilO